MKTQALERKASTRMTAFGRELPFNIAVISLIECPVSVKADIQPGACEIGSMYDRFTPASGHSGNIAVNDRLRR